MLFCRSIDRSPIKKGILLVNFGTPSSPSQTDVRSFLLELFKDQHFPLPPLLQQLIVRTFIIPFRINFAASRYRAIWTDEGSPLLVQSNKFAAKLASHLPEDTAVAVAMRYGNPSISDAVEELIEVGIEELSVFPLFPQQVPSMTHSIISSIFHQLPRHCPLPRLTCIPEFYKEPWYIQASAERLAQASPALYDHVIFSFHGIPERSSSLSSLYRDQCEHSARAIAHAAAIGPEKFSISFQSKVGYGKWTSPSTKEVLDTLLKNDKKRVLVMCPSFVVDCIETLGEIAGEYRANFLGQGGEFLGLVECLNDFQPFVEGVASTLKASA